MSCNKECCSCEKNTHRTDEEKKRRSNRLNRIDGRVSGSRGMIETAAERADVLVQSAAVNAAINSFNKDLLSRHIHSCVVRDIKNGDEEVIDELMKLITKLMK